MEAIKNYLENMFRALPHTPDVLRAKDELWQMMEDKYTELIEAGKTENEAVGTVISEFGNLDELSEALGIRKFITNPQPAAAQKMLTFEETKEYIHARAKQSFEIALGVFFCIISVTGAIACDELHAPDFIGISMLFLFVAIAIGLFVHPSILMKHWDCIKNKSCSIDFTTTRYVQDEKNRYRTTYALLLTLGIILCILSVVPSIIFSEVQRPGYVLDLEAIGAILLFLLVGIGVFMIILACRVNGTYHILLHLNGANTIGGNYVPNQQKSITYSNPVVAEIMSVYWLTVTCLYLIISFLSFAWEATWLIWPIAAILYSILKNTYAD